MTEDRQQLVCSCTVVHEEAVQRARTAELPTSRLLSLSELFKLLGDPSRLRIINALSAAGELCVCDLSAALEMSQSAMSHQLSQLRHAKLVRSRKDGKAAFYALDDQHVSGLLALASEHAAEGRI